MRVTRGGWMLVGASVLVAGLLGPDVPMLVDDVRGPSFPDALVALAALASLVIAGWTSLTAVIVVCGGSSRLVAATTPALLRRALLAGAAGALVVGPAHADSRVTPDLPQRHSVHGLPLPDRPDTVRTAPVVDLAEPTIVEVRPGDTVWAIAKRSLPPGADDADVARATRRWYQANRDVIGDDPDLIHPAQRLVPPTGKDHP